MIRDALSAVHRRMPDGERQSLATRKVRSGEWEAATRLDQVIVDLRRAGVDYETAVATTVAPVRRHLDRVYCRISDHRDLAAASLAETRAQCAVEPMQHELAHTSAPRRRLELLRAMLPRLEYQAEAAELYRLAAAGEIERLEQEIATAQRVLQGA